MKLGLSVAGMYYDVRYISSQTNKISRPIICLINENKSSSPVKILSRIVQRPHLLDDIEIRFAIRRARPARLLLLNGCDRDGVADGDIR